MLKILDTAFDDSCLNISNIFNLQSRLPEITASWLIRYSMFLNEFQYQMQYSCSEQKLNADYFSIEILCLLHLLNVLL